MNPLETEKNIAEYKVWLASKSLHYLTCVKHNYERDQRKENPVYVNLPLRMELITKEIEKRKSERVHNG